MMRARAASRVAFVLGVMSFPGAAFAQSCPAPLADAKRLVLVVADNFTTSAASVQRFEREADGSWRAIGGPASAVIGIKGMAWSQAWRSLATRGEPIKYDGDNRVPAGIYPTESSFGFKVRPHSDYMQIREGDVCVDDPSSPAYNTRLCCRAMRWAG
jgi:L,D-peptidoglycan transpeptidase YkuD (ErfK/YbiS/YcfS/YnhG family)